MAMVRSVERQIERVEGIGVRFLFSGPGRAAGRDVRSDRQDLPGYPYERAAPGNRTVSWWIDNRFARSYSGFAVEVLKEDGSVAHGATLLSTVRAGYA